MALQLQLMYRCFPSLSFKVLHSLPFINAPIERIFLVERVPRFVS